MVEKTRFRALKKMGNGRTDGLTDRWTDIPSFTDARTHKKTLRKSRSAKPLAIACFFSDEISLQTESMIVLDYGALGWCGVKRFALRC